MNAQPPPAVVSSVSAYVIGNYSPRGAATHWDSIPRGSVLHVPGYGRFVVDDRAGPAVPKPYGIDIRCWKTKAECMQFGRRTLQVRIDRPEATSRHKGGRDAFAQATNEVPAPSTKQWMGAGYTLPVETQGRTEQVPVNRHDGWLRAVLTGLLWGGTVGRLLIFVIMKWGRKR
jgi:hypothetical protein